VTYLLDTNVVSALRVRGRHPRVESWVGSVAVGDLFVAALTIAEIERGVVVKERADPAQGQILREWLEERVLPAFRGRVLAFDLAAARILARYPVPARAPYDDALIAATAEAHRMTVVTRNVKHFAPLGVSLVDPWTSSVG
jgi:toxin FitB